MKGLRLFLIPMFALSVAYGQDARNLPRNEAKEAFQPIEGYWQDVLGRTLYKRNASPADSYGEWQARDIGLPYFDSKHIRRVATTYELTDLRYSDDYAIKILDTGHDRIEFLRTPAWSACRMHHLCQAKGDEMLCSLKRICREGDMDALDWQGEERYARRAHCERTSIEQALGIPTRCR
jgi:hypothetical protein